MKLRNPSQTCDDNTPMARGLAALLSGSRQRGAAWIVAAILLLICVETGIYFQFSPYRSQTSEPLAFVTAEEARTAIASRENLLVIDVRTNKEYMGAHLPEAVNMPLYAMPRLYRDIPAQRPVLVHCIYGVRALQAYKLLLRLRPDISDIRFVKGQLVPLTPEKM